MSSRTLLIISCIVGVLGISIGAFGAHALPNILAGLDEAELAKRKDWLETGVQYHMYHAAAILALALYPRATDFKFTAYAWLFGIALFSGCLYAMSMTGIKILGAIVPIGGVSLIVGWLMIGIAAFKKTAE